MGMLTTKVPSTTLWKSTNSILGSTDLKRVVGIRPMDIDGNRKQELLFLISPFTNYRMYGAYSVESFNTNDWTTIETEDNNKIYIDPAKTITLDNYRTYYSGDFDGDKRDELLMYMSKDADNKDAAMAKYNVWNDNTFSNVWNNDGSGNMFGSEIRQQSRLVPIDLCGDGRMSILSWTPKISNSYYFCALQILGWCVFDVTYDIDLIKGFSGIYTVGDDVRFRGTNESSTSKEEKKNLFTDFKIYPNPIYIYITLEMQLNEQSKVEISITDLLGRTVWQIPNEELLRSGKIKMDFRVPDDIKPGIYLLKANIGNEQRFEKIMYTGNKY